MKNFLKQFGKAVCYFLFYLGMQVVVCIGYVMWYTVMETIRLTGAMQAAGDMGMDASSMLDVDAITLGALDYMMQNQNGVVIISGILTIVAFTIFFLIRKKNLLKETNVTKVSVKYVPLSVGLGCSMMLVINFGLALLPESWLMSYAESSNLLVAGSPAAIIISTMIMAPLIEELIFRGLVISRLRKAVPAWAAIVITALLFGLMHGQILWTTYTFVLGVVFGIVAVKTDSIVSSILVHMTFNILGVVIPTLLGDSITVGLCVVMTIIGVLLTAVLLVVLMKMTKKDAETLQTA